MFGHDKDEKDNKSDNVIHPVDTKPADEGLLGVDKKVESAPVKDDDNSVDADKDIEDIVNQLNTDGDDNSSSDDSGSATDDSNDSSTNDAEDAKPADSNDSSSEDSSPVVPEITPEIESEPEEIKSDVADETPIVAEEKTSMDDAQTPPELLEIKKSALQELSPLIDQLDQTPEEKTNILLMTIQATDDQSLVSAAFGAAKSIKDDKKRAQAMLDIINEINYFTQKKK